MATPNTLEKAIWLKLLGLGVLPWAVLGNVYYVDGLNGNNLNDGRSSDTPWRTILFALTNCVNDHDDYIIVMDHWQEAWPVAINKTRVHIIGVGTSPNHPFVAMNTPDDTHVFTVSALSNNCEIAGLSLSGGATSAGIANIAGTPMGLYIHHCVFGHSFAGGAPQDGIRIGLNATNIRIERCIFLGTPGGKGLITRDGIRWLSGGDPLNGNIEENQFKGLPGVAINFLQVADATGGITIKDNVIVCEGDTLGSAISLQATTRGFLVAGNKALYGPSTPGMANNPYLDATIVAPFNTWMANYKGNALVDPA